MFIVNDYPPIKGGQSTYLYNLCRSLPAGKIIVMAPKMKGDDAIDMGERYETVRRKYLFPVPLLGKFLKIILPVFFVSAMMKRCDIKM